MQCFRESNASEKETATRWIEKEDAPAGLMIDDFVFLENVCCPPFAFRVAYL